MRRGGPPVSRRWVLRSGAAAAGGIALACLAPAAAGGAAAEAGDPFAWILLDGEGRVVARCAFTEIGQGIRTLVAAIVAEELAMDPAQVVVEPAPVAPAYANPAFGSMTTGGSTSARAALPALQHAGAALREMLLAAAARHWRCPPEGCEAAGGRIRNRATGAELSYGVLADAAASLPPPRAPAVRAPQDWQVLGRPLRRIDSPDKLRGRARFGIDTVLPGMLLAAVANCPVAGGRLRQVDPAPALAVDGVSHVVPLPDAVLVVAGSFWSAERGIAALRPDWSPGPGAGLDSATVMARLHAALDRPGLPVVEAGDGPAAAAQVRRSLVLEAEVPPLAHAALEPPNATVAIGGDGVGRDDVGGDGVDVWCPTQAPEAVRQAVAAALGLSPASVRVHVTLAGGSFGRNLDSRVVVQAALAARAAGRPVKLIWSRSQDIRHDSYRPPAVSRIVAGLDAAGLPVHWQHDLAVPHLRPATSAFDTRLAAGGPDPEAVEGADDLPYALPYRRLTWRPEQAGLPVGWWRSVGHSFNAWFVEHALDCIAREGGHDPVALRRALLAQRPRHLAVLDAALSLWPDAPPPGRFRGTALHASFGSIVAQSLEISLAEGGIRVHRATCAVDCGLALDPDAIAAQMEGGIVFGLTAALHGEVTLRDGQVVEGNLDGYRLLPMAAAPAISVRILPPPSDAVPHVGGIGEAGVPPVAPALCNAILAATGRPVRSLPVRLP